MTMAGRASWQANISSGPTVPHRALFIRDSCGLNVPEHRSSPPRLDVPVVGHSGDLRSSQLIAAGSQWLRWWQRIVRHQVALDRPTEVRESPSQYSTSSDDGWEALFDWPDFDSLQETVPLREAVRVCGEDVIRFRNPGKLFPPFPSIPTPVDVDVASIAESIITRYRVTPVQLRICVIVLAVNGYWDYMPQDGALFCSQATAQDSNRIARLVEDTFLSCMAKGGY